MLFNGTYQVLLVLFKNIHSWPILSLSHFWVNWAESFYIGSGDYYLSPLMVWGLQTRPKSWLTGWTIKSLTRENKNNIVRLSRWGPCKERKD